jgi:hypothetical protein
MPIVSVSAPPSTMAPMLLATKSRALTVKRLTAPATAESAAAQIRQ